MFLFLSLSGLSACGGLGVTAGVATLTGVSFVHNDKLPTDYLAELATGQDCSYVRHTEDGGAICRSLQKEIIDQPLYCYNEMGGISCYDRDDPYNINDYSTLVR